VREPERRYANAAELSQDLQAARTGGSLLEVTADPQRKPANDVVTAQPGRSDRPLAIDASEAIEDTRIRGELIESQKTKPLTPRGGEKPITPVRVDRPEADVAKSATIEAVLLDSQPLVVDRSAPKPVDAKRSPASASGQLAAAGPSSTAPAEISSSSSRAAEARSRSRTWIFAIASSVAVVAVAGFFGLRSHETPTAEHASTSGTAAQHAAANPPPTHDPEPAPPAHQEPGIAPVVIATPTPPSAPANVAAVPNLPAAQTAPVDPRGSHHAHRPTAATAPHAAANVAPTATSTTPQPAAAHTTTTQTQPSAGAIPSHEMHGATRYEP
jgi:hypothetical protein